jgi:hypothetical protein
VLLAVRVWLLVLRAAAAPVAPFTSASSICCKPPPLLLLLLLVVLLGPFPPPSRVLMSKRGFPAVTCAAGAVQHIVL